MNEYNLKDRTFSLSEYILLSIILLNIFAISTISFIYLGDGRIQVLQILLFLFAIILNINISKKLFIKKNSINLFSILVIAAFFFFIISSFYINIEYNYNIKAISKLLTYPIIVYVFFIYIPKIIYEAPYLFEKLLNYWLYFSIFSIIIAYLFLFGELRSGQQGIAISFFYHPNLFAFIFTFTIPILIYKYFSRRLAVLPFIFIVLIVSVCFLFTFSRAAYLGVFASIAVMMYRRSKITFIIGIVIIIFLALTIVLDFAMSKSTGSFFSRFQVMYVGYNMIFNNGMSKFLWGYGVFNNLDVFKQELTSNFGLHREELSPHNMMILLGIEYGFLLTICVIAAIAFLLIRGFLLKKKKFTNENLLKINLSLSITFGLLVECLFEDIIVYPEFYVMPLFLIFLGYIYYNVFYFKE